MPFFNLPQSGSGGSGSATLSGVGAPANSLGVDGQLYIDTASSTLYGPKQSGSWGSGIALTGASWAEITGKPSTFAPSAHTHAIADVTSLQTSLDGKAASSHTHTIANVTGLQTALDAKQATLSAYVQSVAGRSGVVTITASDVGLDNVNNTADASKPVSTAQAAADAAVQAYAIQRANHTGSQAISTVTGLQTALDGKQVAGSYAAASHTHIIADVTGLQTALDGKQPTGTYATLVGGIVPSSQLPSFVDDVVEVSSLPGTGETGKIYVNTTTGKVFRWGGSAFVEIAGSPGSTDSVSEGSTNLYFTNARAVAALSSSLATKADVSHTHAISDTTGLQAALDGKQAAGSYAAASHTHTASQITDFNTAVVAAAPPTTNASLLTSGTVASARLPVATTTTAGAIVVGSGLSISSGVLSSSSSVVVASTAASFPAIGASNTLYVAADAKTISYWNGTEYVALSSPSGVTLAAPTNLVGVADSGQVSLSWTAPIGTVTDYLVQFSSNDGSTWATFADGTSTAASATVTGLTNGTAYVFRVAAVNSSGTSSYSTVSSSVTPVGPVFRAIPVMTSNTSNGTVVANTQSGGNPWWLFDNHPSEYTTLRNSSDTPKRYFQYTFANNAKSYIGGYTMTSIGLYSSSVSSWELSGSNDGTNFTLLDTQSTSWSSGTQVKSFTLASPANYSTYRWTLTPDGANDTYAGLSAVQLTAVPVVTSPATPTSLTATAGDAQASLAWTAPTDNGGSAITDYAVQFSSNSGLTWTTFADGTSTATSAIVTGLTNGTSYVFRVAAVNGVGTGSYSTASSAVTPVSLVFREIPILTSATSSGVASASAILSGGLDAWRAFDKATVTADDTFYASASPASGNWLQYDFGSGVASHIGGYSITSRYLAQYGDSGTGVSQAPASWTLSGSSDGTNFTTVDTRNSPQSFSYGQAKTFTLSSAVNYRVYRWTWTSTPAGSAVIVPKIQLLSPVPNAPTSLTATGGNAQASLTWTAPSDNGGSAITDYSVQFSSNGGSTWNTFSRTASTTASQVVTGLANGTAYVFRVAAVNGVGTGSYSTASAAVTPTAGTPPNAPTGLTATAGNAQIALAWTAPSAPGTSAITGYTVEYRPSGGSAATVATGSTAASYTLTGLTNGTAYTVRVAAVSAAGTGTYTAASSSVTPVSVALSVSPATIVGYSAVFGPYTFSGAGTAGDKLTTGANTYRANDGGNRFESASYRTPTWTCGASGTLYFEWGPGDADDDGLHWGGLISYRRNGTVSTTFATAQLAGTAPFVGEGQQRRGISVNSGDVIKLEQFNIANPGTPLRAWIE